MDAKRALEAKTTDQLLTHLRSYTRALRVLQSLAVVVFVLGVVMLIAPVKLDILILPVRFCAVLALLASIAVVMHCRSMAVLGEYLRRVGKGSSKEGEA